MQEPTKSDLDDFKNRDASSLKILGFFFTILAVQILIGTFWSLDDYRAVVVNLICGAVLLAVGIGMIVVCRRVTNQQNKASP